MPKCQRQSVQNDKTFHAFHRKFSPKNRTVNGWDLLPNITCLNHHSVDLFTQLNEQEQRGFGRGR